MKKHHLTTIAIILCVSYGVLSWDIITHSQTPTPTDSKYTASCSVDGSAENTDMCCIDYNEALNAAERDWEANLQTLMDQQKPASQMVADAYENLRTYNCWAEYICRAVRYSGHTPIESALGTGLTSTHLGIVPGCQKPEDLKMETQYTTLMRTISEIPVLGVGKDIADKTFIANKVNYFPRCQTDRNNQNPNITATNTRYNACKTALELKFGCPPGTDQATCSEYPNAFVNLEINLKKAHAEQKAAALEKKLGSIVPKMHNMEEHVNYLANFLQALDSRFVCYAGKCQ